MTNQNAFAEIESNVFLQLYVNYYLNIEVKKKTENQKRLDKQPWNHCDHS